MSETNIKRVNPVEAYQLLQRNPHAHLIDVRSKVEFDYVGHPVDATHIAWKEFPLWEANTNFADEVAAAGCSDKNAAILLICRSGARSMSAAEALAAAGYTQLYNVEEGFEGDKDGDEHRGNINGWRFHGLPWRQG